MKQRFFRIWLGTWAACLIWAITAAIFATDSLGTAVLGMIVASLGLQVNLPEGVR